MPVLVSDTSVIIDIERGQLLEEMFNLPYDFVVPDLLYERELAGELGTRLLELGLGVESLSSDELTMATNIRRSNGHLSTPDTFAFAIAQYRRWTLLTGDNGLRTLATEERVDMHGVLWIFDQFADDNLVQFEVLHQALETLSNHPRCRLPTREVNHRLRRFGGT